LDPPPASAFSFVESFVDALLTQPSPKLFIFVRAIFVSYPFLFAPLSEEKKVRLIGTCFDAFAGYEEYLLAKDQAQNQRQKFCEIHSAVLLLSILLTDPNFADLFFRTSLDQISSYTLSQLSYAIKLFLVFFAKSQLLAAVSSSYFLKKSALAKIGEAFVQKYDPEKRLCKETLVVYNTLVQYVLEFFSNLSDVDLIDLDEFMRSDRPFNYLTNGFLRSALSLVPLQTFEAFNSTEESLCGVAMANALLSPPESEEEDTPANFLKALANAIQPTPVESYLPRLPAGIDPGQFKSLEPRFRSLLLRKRIPALPRITPPMMRILLKQPSWVKVCILQQIPYLLLPEHYLVLADVVRELAAFSDDTDVGQLRRQFSDAVFPDDGYLRAALAVLGQGQPDKPVISRCLENLTAIFAYPAGLDRALELIIPVIQAGRLEDLGLVRMILTVAVRSRAPSQRLKAIFGENLLVAFLQPKWRNDQQNMEFLTDLLTSYYRQNSREALPRRVVHLVSFLYMLKLYRSGNILSHFLTDSQKAALKPIVEAVYESLKNAPDDDHQIDLMNLVRAFPFLYTDRPKLLRNLNLLLANYSSSNLDVIAATVNALLTEDLFVSEPESSVALGAAPTPLPMPPSVYNKFPEFWTIIARHRATLTEIARATRFRAFISSPLNFIFRFPIVQDLALKLSYFSYSQRRKLEKAPEIKLEFATADLLAVSVARFASERRPEDWRVRFTPTLLESDVDWFTAVAAELFRPPLFLPTPNLRCVTVNPELRSAADLELYRFAGLFLGLCLLQERRVEARLAPWLLKQILQTPVTLRDMELIDAVKARSLRRLLAEPAAQLGLFFTASAPGARGPEEVELVPGGGAIPVDDGNKAEYVKELLRLEFHRLARAQAAALREGFLAVVEQSEVQMFTADELELLICGTPKISADDLRRNAIISAPYSLEHPVVKAFFAMVQRWDDAQRARLLWFVTGSSALPAGGFEALRRGGCPIQIEPAGDPAALPTAHTCFAILDLPPYPSAEVMEAMFARALDACHQ
jgi:hypothetical protein